MKICARCGELALKPGALCVVCGTKYPDGTIGPEGYELRDDDAAYTGNTRTPPRQGSDES